MVKTVDALAAGILAAGQLAKGEAPAEPCRNPDAEAATAAPVDKAVAAAELFAEALAHVQAEQAEVAVGAVTPPPAPVDLAAEATAQVRRAALALARETGTSVESALARLSPAAAPVVAKAAPAAAPVVPAEPLDDAAWFQATGRSVCLRERREGDPSPFWLPDALANGGVLTVVRNMPGVGRELHAEVLPLDALGGRSVVNTDEGILAALRAASGWRWR